MSEMAVDGVVQHERSAQCHQPIREHLQEGAVWSDGVERSVDRVVHELDRGSLSPLLAKSATEICS